MMSIPSIGNSFEDLEYPEWDQQENEKPKHAHMFELFCAHGGSIRHWARDMIGVHKGSTFHGVEVLYQPYSESSLRELASAHFYLTRRDAKDSYNRDYRNSQMDNIENANIVKKYQQADDDETNILDQLEIKKNELNGTQTKDYVIALNGLRDYKNELRGKPKETKLKVDAEVDGKLNAEVKQHLTAEEKEEKLNELKEKMKEMTYD